MLRILVLVLSSFLAFTALAQTEGSPFTDVQYSNWPSVIVEHQGAEYYLLGINGTSREVIMNQCAAQFQEQCRDLFALQFTQLMNDIGQPVADTVNLRLYNFSNHAVVEAADVPVTAANLQLIKDNRAERGEN